MSYEINTDFSWFCWIKRRKNMKKKKKSKTSSSSIIQVCDWNEENMRKYRFICSTMAL